MRICSSLRCTLLLPRLSRRFHSAVNALWSCIALCEFSMLSLQLLLQDVLPSLRNVTSLRTLVVLPWKLISTWKTHARMYFRLGKISEFHHRLSVHRPPGPQQHTLLPGDIVLHPCTRAFHRRKQPKERMKERKKEKTSLETPIGLLTPSLSPVPPPCTFFGE